MVKNSILNLKDIKTEYSFLLEDKEFDIYFCNCGYSFKNHREEDEEEELKEGSGTLDLSKILQEDLEIYKELKMSIQKEIKCPSCKKNYSNNEFYGMIQDIESQAANFNAKTIPVGSFFVSGYEFEETEKDLFIYLSKVASEVICSELNKETGKDILFIEEIKYIRFEKESKNLYFKDFGKDSKEEIIDLDRVIFYVDRFFEIETHKVIEFYKLHFYISRLSNFVSDTKNGKIVDEFLNFIRNNSNQAGMTFVKKLISIFYGIIKYTNLSTIALTKSSSFLYQLMLECQIPDSQTMINSGATSPVDIFNFLVGNYINKLNEGVNEEDRESQEFQFKSKKRVEIENEKNKTEEELKYSVYNDGVEADYIIRQNKDYKSGKVVRSEDGRFKVLDAIEDGSVSKFIYKKINDFNQYKQIIKYFKFYDKKGVISLLQKYDINLLTSAIDTFYFRNKMETDELDRVLQIIDSYLETRYFFKDYSNIKHFSFVEYDDAKLMMEVMGFDPKRHFNKIKTYDDLVEYHDNLVRFYKVKTELEKSGAIEDFVSKFRFLETKGEDDYNGPLEIELFDTAGRIMREGPEMRHSASEYAANVAQGTYLMGSVFDRDQERPSNEMERYTIGFKYDSKYDELIFDQVKGFANAQGSNRFKRLMMDFLTEKDISFQPIRDLRIREDEQ